MVPGMNDMDMREFLELLKKANDAQLKAMTTSIIQERMNRGEHVL